MIIHNNACVQIESIRYYLTKAHSNSMTEVINREIDINQIVSGNPKLFNILLNEISHLQPNLSLQSCISIRNLSTFFLFIHIYSLTENIMF